MFKRESYDFMFSKTINYYDHRLTPFSDKKKNTTFFFLKVKSQGKNPVPRIGNQELNLKQGTQQPSKTHEEINHTRQQKKVKAH